VRKKIIAGNWKMNTTLSEAKSLAESILNGVEVVGSTVLFFPPFPYLIEIGKTIDGKKGFGFGAQNLSDKAKGAYTGEVSGSMLSSINCNYVLIGHSERREYYNESNDILSAKMEQAFENKLTPIFCCGEPLDQRESGEYTNYVGDQIRDVLFNLTETQMSETVIAYEPIWAIGTGRTASPEQAQEMHALIRNVLIEKFGAEVVRNTSILYGGSVNASNAEQIFGQEDVDGGLVGGASLKADDFVSIISAMEKTIA